MGGETCGDKTPWDNLSRSHSSNSLLQCNVIIPPRHYSPTLREFLTPLIRCIRSSPDDTSRPDLSPAALTGPRLPALSPEISTFSDSVLFWTGNLPNIQHSSLVLPRPFHRVRVEHGPRCIALDAPLKAMGTSPFATVEGLHTNPSSSIQRSLPITS
jgi:hypothetical protein